MKSLLNNADCTGNSIAIVYSHVAIRLVPRVIAYIAMDQRPVSVLNKLPAGTLRASIADQGVPIVVTAAI